MRSCRSAAVAQGQLQATTGQTIVISWQPAQRRVVVAGVIEWFSVIGGILGVSIVCGRSQLVTPGITSSSVLGRLFAARVCGLASGVPVCSLPVHDDATACTLPGCSLAVLLLTGTGTDWEFLGDDLKIPAMLVQFCDMLAPAPYLQQNGGYVVVDPPNRDIGGTTVTTLTVSAPREVHFMMVVVSPSLHGSSLLASDCHDAESSIAQQTHGCALMQSYLDHIMEATYTTSAQAGVGLFFDDSFLHIPRGMAVADGSVRIRKLCLH